jgi:hypothetical protein
MQRNTTSCRSSAGRRCYDFLRIGHAQRSEIITDKTTTSDKNPRIWQATSGFLQLGLCNSGGLALRTVSDSLTRVGDSVLFQPQTGAKNTASGDLLIGVGAKIQ